MFVHRFQLYSSSASLGESDFREKQNRHDFQDVLRMYILANLGRFFFI